MNLSKRAFPLIFILAAFAVLSLVYAWATPPLEASDELWHFGLVNYIADTGVLPVQRPKIKTAWEQEGSQPPLYYLMASALARNIDRSDFDTVRQPNPHAIAGIPGAVGNKNLVLQAGPHPPLEKTMLAIYVVRLFSIVLGCVTVSAVYFTANSLSPGRSHWSILAAGLTAFNPMFLFISASVNNDNLVTALNSLIIWQTLAMVNSGFQTRRSLLLGVLIALTALSKLSGLVLIPVVILAAGWVVLKQSKHDWRGLIVLGLSMAIPWVVTAGWWYARNITLYGELFGTGTMAAVAGTRAEFTLTTLVNEFQGFRFGYWGVFGAFNIMTFRWFYDVMDIVTAGGIAGLIIYVARSVRQSKILSSELFKMILLIVTVTVSSMSVISWTAQTYASQGRLLFPFVAAISVLLAVGLSEIFSTVRIRQEAILVISLAAFGICALTIPFVSIAPAYSPPIPREQVPDAAKQVYARFGDAILVAYETPDRRYAPGETVPITVYWQVSKRSARDLSLYLHAVLADGTTIGKVDSYPGGGLLRTTRWQSGAIYADTYGIPLDMAAPGASKLRIQVGWWDYPSGGLVEAVDNQGNRLSSVMLDAGGFADRKAPQKPDQMVGVQAAHFGGVIRLDSYRLDGNDLTLAWDVTGGIAADYTVFVQVLDGNNQVVGQGDAPPELPTHYWQVGEQYLTQHSIVYPKRPQPGTYRLVIGWYRPDNFERLRTDAPNSAYVLKTIIVP